MCAQWRYLRCVDLVLWYFDEPYIRFHLFDGVRLCSRLLELEAQQRTAAQNTLLIEWHDAEVLALPPVELEIYHERAAAT